MDRTFIELHCKRGCNLHKLYSRWLLFHIPGILFRKGMHRQLEQSSAWQRTFISIEYKISIFQNIKLNKISNDLPPIPIVKPEPDYETIDCRNFLSTDKVATKRFERIYHCGEIITNSREEKWTHSEEVKELAQPINIPTEGLLSISRGNLPFKCRNLIQSHISTLPALLEPNKVSNSACHYTTSPLVWRAPRGWSLVKLNKFLRACKSAPLTWSINKLHITIWENGRDLYLNVLMVGNVSLP